MSEPVNHGKKDVKSTRVGHCELFAPLKNNENVSQLRVILKGCQRKNSKKCHKM